MFRIFALSVFTLVVFTVSAAAQFPIAGQVVDVIDGKTILVAIHNGNVKVELQYIDVPDPGQELHDTVKTHVRNLLMGKSIVYRPKSIFNDHAIGQVNVRDLDISQQLLRDGAAWHLPRETSGQTQAEFDVYASLETAAKNEKLGVWSIQGLKPAWAHRAETKERQKAWQQEEYKMTTASPSRTAVVNRAKFKTQPKGNPAFGNVGSLLNRYDPETKTGLLSTSYLPIDGNKELPQRIGIDITYYYKENGNGKRDGSFVFTVYFQSKAPQFLINNSLMVLDNGKTSTIGKPKRKVSTSSLGDVTETLMYKVDRSTLERAANNEDVFFKIRDHMVFLTGGRYLLYNLLQVTQ